MFYSTGEYTADTGLKPGFFGWILWLWKATLSSARGVAGTLRLPWRTDEHVCSHIKLRVP